MAGILRALLYFGKRVIGLAQRPDDQMAVSPGPAKAHFVIAITAPLRVRG